MDDWVRWGLSFGLGVIGGPRLWDLIERLRRKVTWRSFAKAVKGDRILGYLQSERPDLIIAINDGLVPAAILARNLDVDVCYWTVGPDDACVVATRGCEPDVSNKKVVLLDDQVYSGKRMQAAFERVKRLPGAETATISRMAVFAFETPIRRIPLDQPPALKVRGNIRRMPWSFTSAHATRSLPRE